MSDKNLSILGVAAVIMAGLAFLVSFLTHQEVVTTKSDVPLFQGLNTALIDTIVLTRQDEKATLQRKGNGFVVTDKDNYPAALPKINNLLTSLLEIKSGERLTDNPDNFEELEVTEDKAQHVIRFLDKDQKLITGIIVGKRMPEGNGTCVRKLTNDEKQSNQVYVSPEVRWLQTSALSFVDKEIFKVTQEDIARVTVTGPEGSYSISSDEIGNINMLNIPAGKTAKGTEYERVFSALTSLDFQDVQKQSDKNADLKFEHTYVCQLKDKTVCTFDIAKKDNNYYITCRSEYTEELPQNTPEFIQSMKQNKTDEELKEMEAKFLARDASNGFNKKHTGWIYQIPSYKAEVMTKKLADLLEDKVEEEKDDSPETESADLNDNTEPG
ncbi:MAG: DUF4340 domain-containing protein [Sedimentisphaerales bacterium]|nr:DUF4340 domain-containing protein [Sedimentisphaerales bacterium]